ncbi:MAG: hypothetical protein U5R06_06485 [candidate division KSB1 bacterium]|nr:hypothetical protein [candidate division KSB1 bacterium]
MDHIGPFLYNGLRFALGCLALYPFTRFRKYRATFSWKYVIAGIISGAALFIASSLQQIGLVYTTAGQCGIYNRTLRDPGSVFWTFFAPSNQPAQLDWRNSGRGGTLLSFHTRQIYSTARRCLCVFVCIFLCDTCAYHRTFGRTYTIRSTRIYTIRRVCDIQHDCGCFC